MMRSTRSMRVLLVAILLSVTSTAQKLDTKSLRDIVCLSKAFQGCWKVRLRLLILEK